MAVPLGWLVYKISAAVGTSAARKNLANTMVKQLATQLGPANVRSRTLTHVGSRATGGAGAVQVEYVVVQQTAGTLVRVEVHGVQYLVVASQSVHQIGTVIPKLSAAQQAGIVQMSPRAAGVPGVIQAAKKAL